MLFVYTLWIIKSQPSCFLGIARGLATSLSTATLSPVPHQQCPFINPVASCMLPIINYDAPSALFLPQKMSIIKSCRIAKGTITKGLLYEFHKVYFHVSQESLTYNGLLCFKSPAYFTCLGLSAGI